MAIAVKIVAATSNIAIGRSAWRLIDICFRITFFDYSVLRDQQERRMVSPQVR
jgi:hypothetical protein